MFEQFIQFFNVFSVYQWFALVLNIIGFIFIYINRHPLLYEHDALSLGRVWAWVLFYLAISYWARYIIGIIPPSTPFPPGLDDLIYACLMYELFKKCLDKDLLKLILLRKAKLPIDLDSTIDKEDKKDG